MEREDPRLLTIPAIVVYALLAMVTVFGGALFALIWAGVTVTDVMNVLLGGFFAAVYGWVNLGLGYFFGNSQSGKTANAALSQLAGAGPPPPAPPLATKDALE